MTAATNAPSPDAATGGAGIEVWLQAADPGRAAALRDGMPEEYEVTVLSADELQGRLADGQRPTAIVADGEDLDVATFVAHAPSTAVLVIGAVDPTAGLVDPVTDAVPAGLAIPEAIARLRRVVQARRMHSELARTTEVLAHTSHQLERFVYTASHDLKEPLRAITGFSKLLVTRHADQLEDQARTYLDFVTDGAERLGRMIGSLQTFSLLSRHEVTRAEVSLASVVEGVLDGLDTDGTEVVVEDLPAVRTDRTLVGEVARVLLDNALRYRTDDAGHRVTVTARTAPESWTLVVADTGIGVAPSDHDRIFDMFARLHTREAYAGQGIGLAVARMAAGRLGGRIEVDSRPGEGSTFTVTVPNV